MTTQSYNHCPVITAYATHVVRARMGFSTDSNPAERKWGMFRHVCAGEIILKKQQVFIYKNQTCPRQSPVTSSVKQSKEDSHPAVNKYERRKGEKGCIIPLPRGARGNRLCLNSLRAGQENGRRNCNGSY